MPCSSRAASRRSVNDIIEIITAAREIGYDHVQLNTNGVNLSKDLESRSA